MLCIQDYEDFALKNLSRVAADYYKSGANEQVTLGRNRDSFSLYIIRPRFLNRDVSVRDMSTTFLGTKVSCPIGVAPTAMQKLAHPCGELATAKACETAGCTMVLSTISTSSIEEVAAEAPKTSKWFQLYIYKNRDVTRSLVRRAETNGFKALVVTVDTPFFGSRHADARNNFCLPPHLTLANFTHEKIPPMKSPTGEQKASGLNEYATSLFDASLTWDDISWLKKETSLPILVKGILTAEDAIHAVKHGVSGIVVSNHGARQLDHVPSTIEALPEVVRAVGGKCELYVDGGFRTGTDVLKALALGARGVFVGRPVLWGLAHDGEKGVTKVLEILKRELDVAMALSGCAKLSDIKPDLVVRREFYSHL